MKYIKDNGVEPADKWRFYTTSDELLENFRKALYSLNFCKDEYVPPVEPSEEEPETPKEPDEPQNIVNSNMVGEGYIFHALYNEDETIHVYETHTNQELVKLNDIYINEIPHPTLGIGYGETVNFITSAITEIAAPKLWSPPVSAKYES